MIYKIMSLVLYYDLLDQTCYKGAPTVNRVNSDPWSANGTNTNVTTKYRDNLPWKLGNQTYSKVYEFFKTGTNNCWNGWEGQYGNIFTASINDCWSISWYYKTRSTVYMGWGVGGFWKSDWSAPYNMSIISSNTALVADGQWHRCYCVTKALQAFPAAIIVDGPSWGYSTEKGWMHFGGLQWEYHTASNVYAPYVSHYIDPGLSRGTTIDTGGGIYDLSGNGNHGSTANCTYTYLGNPTFTQNSAGGISVTPNAAISSVTDTSHTFECWIKNLGTPPGANDGYFMGRQGFHSGMFQAKASPTQFNALVYYSDNTNVICDTYATIATNAWAHLVLSVDTTNSRARFYCNGVQVGSDITLTISTTKTLKIYGTNPYRFGGAAVDYMPNIQAGMFKVYNRAITAVEVAQNYKIGKIKYPLLLP